ncbi:MULTISPECIES: glycosyltransferase family 4 protein [Pseudomonas]|uniref:glycosyltransferase family 4 protein n=1 Tax=Pseudomonas TaxID=286 RepID=UPI001C65C54E|nr:MULTISPECIES: glycosyltransferase family 4 protein [unclassified Pseudomonas]MBW8126357.1 glycosyltransferase family 4 protein [Pseudomonas sp. LAP_36]MBW8136028.1 glycosyltransferase family 4 protein [Pseudomonas sp. PAMC 26818]
MNESSMRVLYLHPAAAFGGASKSLIELFICLRALGVDGTVLTPDGPVCGAFAKAGMDVRKVNGLSQFDNTRFSHYRRLRWIILLREIYLLPFSVAAIWRLRHEKFDLLHVNEVTLLPLGIVAKWLLRVPMLVHVRSLQRAPDSGFRTRLVNAWLRRFADAVVPIDHTVAATLAAGLPLSIVHNGLGIENDIQDSSSQNAGKPVRVGFLGVLIPLKGIYELIEAMRILKARNVNIECLIAGENARKLTGLKAWTLRKLGFADDVRANVERMIGDYGLQNQVRMLGFVGDVRSLYPQLDILCFPSHLDAAGRPVFEAAFYSIPSVVAVANPVPDALVHEVTGLAIPRPDPELLADALQRLAEDHALRQALGRQARQWAEENFAIKANAELMHSVYLRLLSKS